MKNDENQTELRDGTDHLPHWWNGRDLDLTRNSREQLVSTLKKKKNILHGNIKNNNKKKNITLKNIKLE